MGIRLIEAAAWPTARSTAISKVVLDTRFEHGAAHNLFEGGLASTIPAPKISTARTCWEFYLDLYHLRPKKESHEGG